MKILILAATLAIQTATLSPASPAPTLAPLRFLAGDWQAVATPAGEEGGFSLRFTVQDRVMIRDNSAAITRRTVQRGVTSMPNSRSAPNANATLLPTTLRISVP